MDTVIDDLVKAVASSEKLPQVIASLEREWLTRELSLADGPVDPALIANAGRFVEAAAILACSSDGEHRANAYRIATLCHDLFQSEWPAIAGTVRVILARLGNFPAMKTSEQVGAALPSLPWTLAGEEIIKRQENQIAIGAHSYIFTDFQRELWAGLAGGKSLAFTAPTSAGKSYVLQAFLASRAANEGSYSAAYVVPTRALISQVSEDLAELLLDWGLRDVEIITMGLEADHEPPPKAIHVLTPERLQVTLQNRADFSVHLIVADEAHSVAEADRGVTLQSVLEELLSRSPAQCVFATPAVSNLSVFRQVRGAEAAAVLHTRAATVAQNFIRVHTKSVKKGIVEISHSTAGELGDASLGHTLSSRIDRLVHISHRFGSDRQSLVYANGAADAEKIAFQLSALNSVEKEENWSPSEICSALSELAAEAVHPNYRLVQTALHGVGFHYGDMPTVLRRAVEQAFSGGDLQFIACTSTLLSGVNLPARNIFLCHPEKRSHHPMGSIDFYNLSGRAGRLQKEFQGNVFLIDYNEWGSKPLDGPREVEVSPALESNLKSRRQALLEIIAPNLAAALPPPNQGLDATFSRLLREFRNGTLSDTLDRTGVSVPEHRGELESALAEADGNIDIDNQHLALSPIVSPHRQQRLLNHFRSKLSAGVLRSLLPPHPREDQAFDRLVSILEVCHKFLMNRAGTDKQNRYFATLLIQWMTGVGIKELIDNRRRFRPNEDFPKSIRETLTTVEKELRFAYVTSLSTYTTVLGIALDEVKLSELKESFPALTLYLEVGACDKTMISLMSLGISRVAARRITDACPFKTMDAEATKRWLRGQNLDMLGLSPFLLREVERVLALSESQAT